MSKHITFKNMEHSQVIENFANDKLAKIEDIIEKERTPTSIDMVIEAHKVHAYNIVELRVRTADFYLIATHEGPDIYYEIDHVVDTMVENIRKARSKQNQEYKIKDDSFKGA